MTAPETQPLHTGDDNQLFRDGAVCMERVVEESIHDPFMERELVGEVGDRRTTFDLKVVSCVMRQLAEEVFN